MSVQPLENTDTNIPATFRVDEAETGAEISLTSKLITTLGNSAQFIGEFLKTMIRLLAEGPNLWKDFCIMFIFSYILFKLFPVASTTIFALAVIGIFAKAFV